MTFLILSALTLVIGIYFLMPSIYNPLAGLEGFVKVDGTPYAFTKWGVELKCKVLIVNNFTGVGYQQVIPGLLSATLTLSALTYDQGNMAFAAGDFEIFVLGYTSGISLSLQVLIESIKVDVDYEGLEAVTITGQSDGEFDAFIT